MLQQLRKKNIVEWYIKKHEEEKIQLLSITFNLIFFFFLNLGWRKNTFQILICLNSQWPPNNTVMTVPDVLNCDFDLPVGIFFHESSESDDLQLNKRERKREWSTQIPL